MKGSGAVVSMLVALGMSLSHGQPAHLGIGDSVTEYLRQNPPRFVVPMGNLSPWAEGRNVSLLTYQQGSDSTKPGFLSSSTGIPFGVLQGSPSNAHFLFDTDGDGALDYRTEKALIPIWLVSRSSPVADSASGEVRGMLDILYDAFQSDEGMVLSDRTKPVFEAIARCNRDTLFPNRDIVYQLWYYFAFTERDPSLAVAAIRILEGTYVRRFGAVHPVIKQFEIESALQIEDSAAAREPLGELLRLAPDFIPGKYYACVLEQDEEAKGRAAAELKRSHGDHWLVMRIDR